MTPARRVLLLGGTGEARELAGILDALSEFAVVSSLAGRVRNPVRPAGEVRVGGFGGIDGLRVWLRENRIDQAVDATHPFATTIHEHAVTACAAEGVPLTVLRRPPWTPLSADRWESVPTMAAAATALDSLEAPSTVFLTTGRQDVATFAPIERHRFVIRAIDPPQGPMPGKATVVLARGPFALADELNLMTEQSIDVVVSKNSGGEMTRAKLEAARRLELPVVMIDRPPAPVVSTEFQTAHEVVRHLIRTAAT